MQRIGRNWILIVPAIAILAFFFLQCSPRGRRGGFGGGHGRGGDGPDLNLAGHAMLKQTRREGLWRAGLKASPLTRTQPSVCTA